MAIVWIWYGVKHRLLSAGCGRWKNYGLSTTLYKSQSERTCRLRFGTSTAATLTMGAAGWKLNCTTVRKAPHPTGQQFLHCHCREGNNLTSYIDYGIYFKKVRNSTAASQKRLSSKNSLLSSIVYLVAFLDTHRDLGVTLNLQCTILELAKVKL